MRKIHAPVLPRSPTARRPRARSCAFTITELIVVLAVIGLLLGIGLPAFRSMNNDAKFASATQSLAGLLNRTSIGSLGESNPWLIRFVPAEWDVDPNISDANAAVALHQRTHGRQKAATFRYVSRSYDPNDSSATGPSKVIFTDGFERVESGPEVLFPADMWLAPAEALAHDPSKTAYTSQHHVLNGVFGEAEDAFDPNWTAPDFLDADDFTVAIDGAGGVRRGPVIDAPNNFNTAERQMATIELRGVDPRPNPVRRDITLARRYFSGLLLYQREVFQAQGNQADAATTRARRDYLAGAGRSFYVGPGGSLISGGGGR